MIIGRIYKLVSCKSDNIIIKSTTRHMHELRKFPDRHAVIIHEGLFKDRADVEYITKLLIRTCPNCLNKGEYGDDDDEDEDDEDEEEG